MSSFIQRQSLPIFLLSPSLLFFVMGDQASRILQFDRDATLHGEIWRLLTGHLIHSTHLHLLLNILGLLLIWILTGRYLPSKTWWLITAGSALLISLSFLIFMPNLQWYMGLSGLLHAIFAAGIVAGIKKGDKECYLLAFILLVKIVWEGAGQSPISSFISTDMPIITASHLYGVIYGLFLALFLTRRSAPPS